MPTRPSNFFRPKIDYRAAKRMWFVHADSVYSVLSAPSFVFQDAVLAQSPYWISHELYGPVLEQTALDYQDRWWLLCCLADKNLSIRLYPTREAAEQARIGRIEL